MRIKKGQQFVNRDTGQVWHVKSVRGDEAVMQWEDAPCFIECMGQADFWNVFVELPKGPKRKTYLRPRREKFE